MKMQREWFPIFSFQLKKRTGSPSCCWLCDNENKDNAGGREKSQKELGS